MRRHPLGGTGISVTDTCLGTMMFGSQGNRDHDEAVRMVHAALDAGINLVDTADVYSGGECEQIVGRALEGRRDEVVLASKVGLPVGPDENRMGASRRWITTAIDASLRRLRTDRLDLYQVHRFDPRTDLDETLSALTDLVRAGKIRAFGCSTFPVERIVEAHWVSERRGHERFRTEQPRYSILSRGIEAAVLPTALRHGMGVLTYGPLAAGWLSGRADPTSGHRASGSPQAFDLAVAGNQAKLEAVGRLGALADEAGVPMTHLATAFVRAHPAVTSVIIGPRTPEQLDDLLAGADLELDDEVLDRIDEIVPPGIDLNPADVRFATPAELRDPRRRRRR